MHRADGADPHITSVMRRIWPFCGVMFAALMLVAYIRTFRSGCRGCCCG